MRRVVIIGNSGAARECYWLLMQVCQKEKNLQFAGFLSFEGYPHDLCELAKFELGIDDDYLPKPDDVFVIGTGIPSLRSRIYQKWKQRGAAFINLAHPDVFIPPSTTLGEGNIIAWGNFISCNISMGNANYLNTNVTLAHDVVMGDFNFIGAFSIVQGHACLGSANMLASHTSLLANARIGDANSVAPGSVVFKGCGSNTRLAGNPAFSLGKVK